MPSFLDILVVLGMMTLRFGVPALVVAALVYGLKRLDARWEAEARDYAAKHPEARVAEQPAAPRPTAPALPARKPAPAKAPELPFVIPPAIKDQRIQPGMTAEQPATAAQPTIQPGIRASAQPACWDAKSCSDATKGACPAPQHPDQPCWQARFDAEGQIPEDCVKCDVFQRYPMM